MSELEGDSSDGAPEESPRDRLLSRFAAWLDEALADEPPPEGLPAELLARLTEPEDEEAGSVGDLHGVRAALTALTQEVKLQSRGFKELSVALERQDDRRERDAARRGQRSLLEALFDARDRMTRGLDAARNNLEEASSPGLLARLLGQPRAVSRSLEAVRSLEEGCRLGIDRLDEALASLDVRPVAALGEPFDPDCMAAVATEEVEDPESDGEVLLVLRPGYSWRGEIVRTAQVKVARVAARSSGEER